MNDTPFDTIGDEPVEARIVAWVLGESSAFEAAELERLCEERPELLVFRRRMRALHGLLTEAEASEPDHSWKLPPGKHKLLDEIFGAEIVLPLDSQKDLRVRRISRRALLAIAACLILTIVVAGLTPPMVMRQRKRSGIDISGSSSFTLRDDRSELKRSESLPAVRGMIVDREEKIEEERDVAGSAVRAKDSDESLARNGSSSQFFDKNVQQPRTALGQQPAPAAAPAAPPVVTGKDDSFAMSSTRQAGLKENARQLQPAKKPAIPQSTVLAADAPQALPALDAPSEIEALPEFANRIGIGGGAGGFRDARARVVPPSQPAPAAAEPAQLLAKDSPLAAGERSTAAREMETPNQIPADRNLALGDRLGTDTDGWSSNMTEFGVTSGLRSGDQAINRNSIDAILNVPSRSAAGENKTKGLKAESDAKPPVLADLESSASSETAREPAALGGSLTTWGGSMPELAEAGKKLEADEPSGDGPQLRGILNSFGDVSPEQLELSMSLRRDESSENAPTGSVGGGKISKLVEGEQSGSASVQEPRANVSLAQHEMVRRQSSVSESDALLKEGRDAYAKGDYQQASDKYGRALEKLPDAPMLGDRRQSYSLHLADADVALAIQNRKVGKYSEARELLRNTIATNPDNAEAKRELELLEDPIRTNPALTYEHTQNVDKVRRALYTAEGNFNLGKYDDSKKAYEEVLRTDPYNSAARRGLEQVAVAKSDYYRAAYDHTRAELLGQVDSAWELKVPAHGKNQEFEGTVDYGAPILGQLFGDQGAAADPFAEAKRTPADLAEKDVSQFEFRGSDLSSKEAQSAAADPFAEAADQSSSKLAQRELESIAPAKPAQQKLVDLMEEIPATENPYSTFSLNISDASFQLAKAALAKGERPDPESIKPEQFYNAVDYGDPAPSSNEPVAATIEQSAHPVIPGRNLVRVALRTGSAGRSAAQPLRLTLLVDQSGSMVREDRRASMEHALAQLGGLLTKADFVTVVGFSRTPHLLAESMTGDQAGKLGDLVNQTASEGGTNLEEAIKLGAEKALSHQLAGAQNRIVLFTDGAANLGNANHEHLAAQVKALRQKGIAFDIAGIGVEAVNDPLLSELARNGNGRYYVVGSEKSDSFARQLAGAFRPAAENVKVQVNFNPQRVGKYKLIGFEKDRLKTEDFRNDAVDAAELAAEEAGVAIYQVEPLTEGTGELGEVSVRFRDAASGQMVERAWTIPYASQATAFDRATPSMQLAGLSLLAAEKLKGGPLADAIDFKQLTGPSAFVKQFYGSSPRVSEMLQVIEKLK